MKKTIVAISILTGVALNANAVPTQSQVNTQLIQQLQSAVNNVNNATAQTMTVAAQNAGAIGQNAQAIGQTNAALGQTNQQVQQNTNQLQKQLQANTALQHQATTNYQAIGQTNQNLQALTTNVGQNAQAIGQTNAAVGQNTQGVQQNAAGVQQNAAGVQTNAAANQQTATALQQMNAQGTAGNAAKIEDLRREVHSNRHRASAAISGVAALAGIPQVMPGQTFFVGAGVGTTDGESALAVGGSARLSENWVVKAGVSNDTQHNFTVNGGFGYGW